jgi:hypothetical protein
MPTPSQTPESTTSQDPGSAIVSQKIEMYRNEDKHECSLLIARINALLTSQSFFLIAGVILYTSLLNYYKPSEGKPADALLPSAAKPISVLTSVIALVAFTTAILAGTAIVIGCRILRLWHSLGKELIQALRNDSGWAGIDNWFLKRNQPDDSHTLSMDIFGIGLASVFVIFWAVVLCWLGNLACIVIGTAVLVLAVAWGFRVIQRDRKWRREEGKKAAKG